MIISDRIGDCSGSREFLVVLSPDEEGQMREEEGGGREREEEGEGVRSRRQ